MAFRAIHDLGTYILVLLRQWTGIVMGSLLFMGVSVYEHVFQKNVSWHVYGPLLALALFVGSFGAWREERAKNVSPRLRTSVTEAHFLPRMTSLSSAESLTDIFVVVQCLVENIGLVATNLREIEIEMVSRDGEILRGAPTALSGLRLAREVHTTSLTKSFIKLQELKIEDESDDNALLAPHTSSSRWKIVTIQDMEKAIAESSTLRVSIVDGVGKKYTATVSSPWPRTGSLVQRVPSIRQL
jgi:hypothetical protein